MQLFYLTIDSALLLVALIRICYRLRNHPEGAKVNETYMGLHVAMLITTIGAQIWAVVASSIIGLIAYFCF